MYQTYNLTKESYGVIYRNREIALDMGKLHSAIFRSRYFVIDTDTGEIIAEFDMGLRKEA